MSATFLGTAAPWAQPQQGGKQRKTISSQRSLGAAALCTRNQLHPGEGIMEQVLVWVESECSKRQGIDSSLPAKIYHPAKPNHFPEA